ncbi:MAG TPA: enoyl-CoA hydratase/isomerase family protein [Blastocatellia bacterium]|nr:enoyl-CoA hydratase/isomerase family protein [Blastocatellia bacterium]
MTETRPQLVLRHREGAVLTLTLNRPEKSNSLHPDLVKQLSAALKTAEADTSLSAVVITGAGSSFCAGLDLELLLSWSVEQKLDYLEAVVKVFRGVWSLPQPVIAAVNGPAIAGGFDLAAFCDIRLAAREAVFGQAEINVGLTQIIHPLYKSIGLARAKELAMTGQNITADEAFRIGLVNHVYPREELMPRAMEMARVFASKPRNALFETKRLTRVLIDLDTNSALEEIRKTFKQCLASKEHLKQVADVYAAVKKSNKSDKL